ncbi:MAG: adenylosuccinate lyase [Euryarchaeota archaeon]|nr:adenylosuccinate lyase [Euryarchaeota archaeon]
MAIHPIESRYGTPEMRRVWSEEARLRRCLEVEVALARAEESLRMVPRGTSAALERGARRVTLARVKTLEARIGHDLMALVKALAERSGPQGEYAHYGATSYDIVDTALALQMEESLGLLEAKLHALLGVLVARARETRRLVCAGRTHGQIAVPTTYGMRFALWAEETGRHLERLCQMRPRLLVGKISGAVGTGASLGPRGMEVERRALRRLGLSPVPVASQIVQRDRHAEYILFLAQVATTLDKICTQVRTLQRTEIGEAEEPFGESQVGSSTMPHKRNPIKSEQVCGIARVVRGMAEPALLNNTLWDERDLTNSSAERILLPEASILVDHILQVATGVLRGLRLHEENIRRNLEHAEALSEAVMMALAPHLGRQRAHETVRRTAQRAHTRGQPIIEALQEERDVARHLTRRDLKRLLKPEAYIGSAVERVDAVVARWQRRLKK